MCGLRSTRTIPTATARAAGALSVARAAGWSRTTAKQSAETVSVTRPTMPSAPRHPATATRRARGAVEARAPTIPTVTVTAERKPKRPGGNHVAATLRAPMNVVAAPSPTANRAANSARGVAASPIPTLPNPITSPPTETTRRTPNASMQSPAGIMRPAYA